jgi:hypothetical protein
MAMSLRIAFIASIAISLGACSSFGPRGVISSATHAELSPAAASAIAGDMVSRFAEHVGPGTGTIVLKRDNSAFGQALEAALRGWGYAVATDQRTDDKGVALAYVIDSFDGAILARLSTQQIDLGRAYTVTAAGATPTSPVSVMQRG